MKLARFLQIFTVCSGLIECQKPEPTNVTAAPVVAEKARDDSFDSPETSDEAAPQVPVIRDVYRQALNAGRSQIDAISVEERLRALATQIERETKEIP